MISSEQIQKLVIALKSHTTTSIESNQDGTLPYVYEAKKEIRYPKNYVEPDDSVDNDAVYFWQNNHLVCMDRYHYDDKWYPAIDSADEPNRSFGIIRLDDIAYRTFEPLMNKKSFIMRMDALIYLGLCEPFMLFLDRKFVNWYDIQVVYDCGDTYLLLYGKDYVYQKLKFMDMHLVILPYNIDYIGIEHDSTWEMNYEMITEYLQSTLELKSGKIHINVPDIGTVYDTGIAVYGVGGWLFTQLRLYYAGLMSEEREDKLKKIYLVYREYDESGNAIETTTVRFNALDKDSYNFNTYIKICHMSYDGYLDRALFRFSDETKMLDMDNGDNILALLDESLYTDYIKFDASEIYYNQNSVDQILYRNSYLTFKNGLFYPEVQYDQSLLNNIHFINSDNDTYEFFTFLNSDLETPITLYSDMEKNYLNSIIQDYIGTDKEDDYSTLIEKLSNWLNYEFTDDNLYDDNQSNGFNSILNYDVRFFNGLYSTNTKSCTFTGDEANTNLVCTWGIENRRGLKIPRQGYRSHETYVMVYKNGELLDTYYKMIAFSNYFIIPIEEDSFDSSDIIEIVYITDINNNEIHFYMTDNMLENCFTYIHNDDYKMTTNIFDKYINPYDLKIFCNYPKSILDYFDTIDNNIVSNDIAFNISYREDGDAVYLYRELFDKAAFNEDGSINDDIEYTAVSERKFIYERLYVDQYCYRIKLSSRFRYCDNQRQYMLFINGRRAMDESFLITIPKWTRPFWGMYLYTTRFISPDDRVELFYLPYDVMNMNIDDINEIVSLDESGFLEIDRDLLKVPLDSKFYEWFMNGKHIPASFFKSVDSHTLRLTSDPKTLKHITFTNLYRDSMPEVEEYMQSEDMCARDDLIDFIKTSSLGYDELDNLFNIHNTLTDSEDDNVFLWDTGPIAIINEIIRDFWVTSGYQYNDVVKFIYDYTLDEYLVWDDRGYRTLPSMDATQYINIEKNYIHLLYFIYEPEETQLEIGSVLEEVTLNWEYSTPIYGGNGVIRQDINGEDIGNETRSYYDNTGYTEDVTFTLTGNTTSGVVKASVTYTFCNGIYYGLVDEDSLQWYGHKDWMLEGLYFVRPNDQLNPSVEKQENEHKMLSEVKADGNTVIYNLEIYNDHIFEGTLGDTGTGSDDGPDYGYNSNGLIEYYKPDSLYLLMPELNKIIQDKVNLDLEDYIIGPNNYFVYAAPYRLCWNDSDLIIRFIGPDITDLELRESNLDDHTDPLYTNGWWDSEGQLIRLTEFTMEYMGTFTYSNQYGYTEPYCMWKSNGFFTRNYDNTGVHIIVYSINDNESTTIQTVFSDDD